MRDESTELASVKEFRETFIDEFVSFESNARGLAQGHGTFSNSKWEWAAIGTISSSVVLINATIGILAGLSIIAGPVGTALGICVSLAGVMGGIAFNRARNAKNRRLYKETVDLMDRENIKNDIDVITACLIDQKADYLATCTPEEAIKLAKETNKALADALTNGKMKTKAEVLQWASKGKSDINLAKEGKRFVSSTTSMLGRFHMPEPDQQRAANLAFSSSYSDSPAVQQWRAQRQQVSTWQKVKNFFGKVFSLFGGSCVKPVADVELKPAVSRSVFR